MSMTNHPGARSDGAERGAARGRGGRGTPVQHPSQPCLRCGSDGHNRSKCPEPKTSCRFCGLGADHLGAYCPKNPTAGARRKALSPSARAVVDREAGSATATPSAKDASVTSTATTASTSEAAAHAAAAAGAAAQTNAMRSAYAYSAILNVMGYGCPASTAALSSALTSSDVMALVLPPKPAASAAAQAEAALRAAIADGGLSALDAAIVAAPREVRAGGVGVEARALYGRLLEAQREAEREARAAEVPDDYICPITSDIMTDPVATMDGFTYERAAITEWLRTKDTSPKTGSKLESKALIPNHLVRSLLRAFKEAGSVPSTASP